MIKETNIEHKTVAPQTAQPVAKKKDDVELQALTALVQHETAMLNADLAKYGEPQFNPCTPPYRTLYAEMEKRGMK